MKRRYPDPRQSLFRWVWSDPTDDRPDRPDDYLEDEPPPLRGRVRQRHSPRMVMLWSQPVRLADR
jgi:hypothetical protein